MSDMGDGEGPLARWSRRKAAARREPAAANEAPAVEAPPDAEEAAPSAPADEALTEAEALEAHGLPAPEDLGLGDDFSRFMGAEIPEALRRRALRQLWRVNPALANLDGLVEYGEDYTDSATVVGALKTAYRVGRGFMTDDELEQREAGAAPTAEPDVAASEETGDGEPRAGEPEAAEPAPEASPAASRDDDGAGSEVSRNGSGKHSGEASRVAGESPHRSRSRRMNFHFDEN